MSLGMKMLPSIGKTLGISALAGLASGGMERLVKGKGIQSGGFLIPAEKIADLIR